MLTARAHNLMYAAPRLDATIRRLQAFEKAGADVLFAPGLSDLAAVRAVCDAVSKPVNFYRAAMTGFLSAATEVKEAGQFSFLDRCASTAELIQLMRN
jgi:2-methylisocitrate lyase-like PEP mutase family enzyme